MWPVREKGTGIRIVGKKGWGGKWKINRISTFSFHTQYNNKSTTFDFKKEVAFIEDRRSRLRSLCCNDNNTTRSQSILDVTLSEEEQRLEEARHWHSGADELLTPKREEEDGCSRALLLHPLKRWRHCSRKKLSTTRRQRHCSLESTREAMRSTLAKQATVVLLIRQRKILLHRTGHKLMTSYNKQIAPQAPIHLRLHMSKQDGANAK